MKKIVFIIGIVLLFMAVNILPANASMIIKTSSEDSIYNNIISEEWVEDTNVDFTFYEVAPFNITDFDALQWGKTWQDGVTTETPGFFNIGFSYIVSTGYTLEVQSLTDLDIPDIVADDYWVMDSFFKMDTVFWYYNYASGENVVTKRKWLSKSFAVFNPVFDATPVPLPSSLVFFASGLILLVGGKRC